MCLMTRPPVSRFGCDPFTAFRVDGIAARIKAAKKRGDWQGERCCKGLQCLERGESIAIFDLGIAFQSKAPVRLASSATVTSCLRRKPRNSRPIAISRLFSDRSLAHGGVLGYFSRHSRGGFFNTHLSTSIAGFGLLIYGPVFLLVSYL